jgi:hypothetical protein
LLPAGQGGDQHERGSGNGESAHSMLLFEA